MRKVNLAEAKARLSELVAIAAAGEPICILRRGKAVARLIAAESERKPIDPSVLRAVTETMPLQQETARDFIRRVRDDERY
jgi:prevent-host-death family protein